MTHINQRRDTAGNWTATNPVLMLGEVGWERDTGKAKLGDGVTDWNTLDYAVEGPPNLSAYAPLASPVFTGTPEAPTQTSITDDESLATTEFVHNVADPISSVAAAAIPEATVDAKGDLIVGTADDTVARLPVGSDATFLRANAGETTGLEWSDMRLYEAAAAPSTEAASVGSLFSESSSGGKLWLKRAAANLASSWRKLLPSSFQNTTLGVAANPTSTSNVTFDASINLTIPALDASDIFAVILNSDVTIVTGAGTNIIELLVDGVQTGPALVTTAANGTRVGGARMWPITGLSVGNHTISFRTRMLAGSTSANVTTGTTAYYHQVA